MNWKEGVFCKVQVKTICCLSSVWDFGNQTLADAGVASTLVMHKWCMLASNACCWKISWTATSNWWSGRKGFVLEMKAQDKKPLLHSHYRNICLFGTFESKPWQMRGKSSITSSGTWWHGWRAALSRFHCLHAFDKFGKTFLRHCTFIRLPASTSDARRSTSLFWGRCRLSWLGAHPLLCCLGLLLGLLPAWG